MESCWQGKRLALLTAAGLEKMLVFSAAVGLSAVAVGADAAGNLLKNGDFEKGFSDWRKAGAIWRVEDGAGYGGTKGLVWECNDAEKYIYPAQYVKLEAGSAYRITALVKVDELKGGGQLDGCAHEGHQGIVANTFQALRKCDFLERTFHKRIERQHLKSLRQGHLGEFGAVLEGESPHVVKFFR